MLTFSVNVIGQHPGCIGRYFSIIEFKNVNEKRLTEVSVSKIDFSELIKYNFQNKNRAILKYYPDHRYCDYYHVYNDLFKKSTVIEDDEIFPLNDQRILVLKKGGKKMYIFNNSSLNFLLPLNGDTSKSHNINLLTSYSGSRYFRNISFKEGIFFLKLEPKNISSPNWKLFSFRSFSSLFNDKLLSLYEYSKALLNKTFYFEFLNEFPQGDLLFERSFYGKFTDSEVVEKGLKYNLLFHERRLDALAGPFRENSSLHNFLSEMRSKRDSVQMQVREVFRATQADRNKIISQYENYKAHSFYDQVLENNELFDKFERYLIVRERSIMLLVEFLKMKSQIVSSEEIDSFFSSSDLKGNDPH